MTKLSIICQVYIKNARPKTRQERRRDTRLSLFVGDFFLYHTTTNERGGIFHFIVHVPCSRQTQREDHTSGATNGQNLHTSSQQQPSFTLTHTRRMRSRDRG
jgi:hypothetical protein